MGGWVALGWVGSGRVGLNWVELGREKGFQLLWKARDFRTERLP